jgi:hypothetical protein
MALVQALRRGRLVTDLDQIAVAPDGALELTGYRLSKAETGDGAIRTLLDLVLQVGHPTPDLADIAASPPRTLARLTDDLRYAGIRARRLHGSGLGTWLVRERQA